MANAVREDILAAILARLQAAPVTVAAANVERDRIDPVQKWPFLVVMDEGDEPAEEQVTGLDALTLSVSVEIHVKPTATATASQRFNAHYAEVVQAVKATTSGEPPLGVAGCREVELAGVTAVELAEDVDDDYLVRAVRFAVLYETDEFDPTSAG